MDALDPLGGVLHQHQVILIRQLGQIPAGPGAHFSAGADDSYMDFPHDPFHPFNYNAL